MRLVDQPPEWEPLPKYSLVAIFVFFALIIAFGSGCVSIREYRSGIASSYQKGKAAGQKECLERKYWGHP